jgi:hypothetical protein
MRRLILRDEGLDRLQQDIKVSPSMWEVPLLTGQIGTAGGAFTWLLLAGCVVLQLLLTLCILFRLALLSPYNDQTAQALRAWRRDAHTIKNMNGNFLSLAYSVCNSSLEIGQSARQTDINNELSDYLDSHWATLGVPVGPMLCMLALVMWIFSVSKEVRQFVSFVRTILVIPTARTTTFEVFGVEGSALRLVSLSRLRLACVLGIQGVRLTIAVMLLFAGIVYLVNIVSVGDLILNAVALEFVLGIDELIFDA